MAIDSNVLFGNTLETAAKALDLRSRRHELIVSNLANADTPGYKAFDLMVEESIQNQGRKKAQIQMIQTHSGHIPSAPNPSGSIPPKMFPLPELDNLRGDGNTVDTDREMSNLATNQLLYNTSAQVVSKKFQELKNVITGGK